MSTNTTTCIDVALDTTNIEVKDEHTLVTSNTHPICATPNQEITAEKREYSIVGDAYYASTYPGSTPTWLSELIDTRVDTSVQNGLTDYNLLVQDVRNAIDSIDVAKNTFVEEIAFETRVDGIVGVHLDTLNATYNDKFATIANLDIVEANANFARTTQANDLRAEFNEDVSARITSVQQAFSDADSAIADDVTALTTRIDDQEAGLSANADAVTGLQTFVGIDKESAYPNGTGMLARVGLLEKQNDGLIEYITGTYDVMTGVEEDNSDTSNDELKLDALPYVLWTTIVGTGAPSSILRDYVDYSLETPAVTQTQVLEGTLYERTDYTNNDLDKYYQFSESSWSPITAAQFLLAELELRSAHVGDVYVKYATNDSGVKEYLRGYKFIKTAKDLSSPYSGDLHGFTWALITDTDTQSAYMAAINAKDLADSKRRVFVVEPFPPYDIGDLWVDTSVDPQIVKVATVAAGAFGTFNSGHWQLADETAKKFIEETYTPDSAQLHRQLDGKIEYLFLNTHNDSGFSLVDVTGSASEADTLDLIDDLWGTVEQKDDANGNIVYFMDSENAYWYQASTPAWIEVLDTSIYKALKDAATAQGAADGKVSQFYAWGGASAPADYTIVTTPEKLGEDGVTVLQAEVTEPVSASDFLYWFKADNKLYYKPDTSWVEVPTTAGSGQYISAGDIAVVFDPEEHDTTAYSFSGTNWQITGPNGIISKSKWFVDLDNDVRGAHGHVASSMNDLTVAANLYADNKSIGVENKFAYDSKIVLDGKYYEAGFGLDSSGITQVTDGLTEGTAFDSEFWINAERLVLKSPSHPSVQAAFKVTETGIVLGLENTEATRNEPKGTYSSSTTYLKGDIVTYNGSSYVALETLKGVVPVDGSNWSLLAAAGDSPLLYDWEGSFNWPTSTNEAGAYVVTFDSAFPGNTTIRIEANDAEGGMRVKFNDSDEQVLSGPDNADKWYTLHFDNLVAGNNTLKVWSSTADGGTVKKIKAAFVGATGASGEGARSSTVLVHTADLGTDTPNDALSSMNTYWSNEASAPFGAPIAGDSLVLTNTNPVTGWTHIFGYDGSGWIVRAAFTVNGDVIVEGTVVSKALATDIIIGKDATFEGKVELVGSTHKRVSSAVPFGTTNQFIEWFGPASVSEDDMSEGNAITYLKTDGSAYFGGAIVSGALTTSLATSSLATDAEVEIGPFGSNGGNIGVNCSVSLYMRDHMLSNSEFLSEPSAPLCSITLEEYVGGVWVHRQSASYEGTKSYDAVQEGGDYISNRGQALSGSFTYTDNKQTTANRRYRLRMTSRTGLLTGGVDEVTQRLSLHAQEV